jgi:hypothetical protein
MMSQEAVSEVCSKCDGTLCSTCSLCVECVPGHDDGYGGELYAAIDALDHFIDTHSCNPSRNPTAITALLEEADAALTAVLVITGHTNFGGAQ